MLLTKPQLAVCSLVAMSFLASCAKEKGETYEPSFSDNSIVTQRATLLIDTISTSISESYAMAVLSPTEVMVAEKNGTVKVLSNGQEVFSHKIGDVHNAQEGGILDLVLHPDYAANGWVYLSYVANNGQGTQTTIVRFEYANNQFNNETQIYQTNAQQLGQTHYGSRISFDGQNRLYVSIGDRGDAARAQNPSVAEGKIIRLNDDGSIPQDNPFASNSTYLPEVYTMGHKNVQGLYINPYTEEMWAHDNFVNNQVPVYLLTPGANYGWNTGTASDSPVYSWNGQIAPCGLAQVFKSNIPAWDGSVIIGAKAARQLVRLESKGGHIVNEEILLNNFGEFTDVRNGVDGYVYAVTTNPNMVLRIREKQ